MTGIVDTGTTLLMLPSSIYDNYMAKTGAVVDAATGWLRVDATQFGNLQDLTFSFNGQSITLTPNAQIWPRALNSAIGGDPNGIYLIVASMQTDIDVTNFDFVLGKT